MGIYTNFISSITGELKKPLPGRNAQFKMAPENRVDVQHTAQKENIGQKSAVMVLIFPEKGIPNICFIRRQDDQGPHSGQISFPGGRVEEKDSNLWDTALRETAEEIGVSERDTQYVGKLTPLYIPVSNFWVHPFIGCLQNYPRFETGRKEVKYLLKIPVSEIIEPEIIKKGRIINNLPTNIPYYNCKGEIIWGATAMILTEFIEISSRILPDPHL